MSETTIGNPGVMEFRLPDDTVTIRELRAEDAQAYFDLVEFDRDHLSQQWNETAERDETADKYQTVEDVEESIRNPNPNKYRFGIWDGDTMVGSNNLIIIDEGIGESGSWIGAEHTGHNYAARGRKLLLDFAFNTLGLKEVVSRVNVGNHASRASVEKSGYKLVKENETQWIFSIKREDYDGN